MKTRTTFGRIGPAFIAGACIIGPGSVTLTSKTGWLYGYSMLWLAPWPGALMAGFIALFMRFGTAAMMVVKIKPRVVEVLGLGQAPLGSFVTRFNHSS